MAKRVIVLSGPVAAGKTTLARSLVKRYGFHIVKTRQLLQSTLAVPASRVLLQRAGDRLDRRTRGSWVGDALARLVSTLPHDAVVVADSVRIKAQVDAIREAFGPRVVHVHLTAPAGILSDRYAQRASAIGELPSYAVVQNNMTEKRADTLADYADIVIDTRLSSADDVVVRVAAHLGLYERSVERLVDVIIGGQYGSEGKGHICSYLAREYDYLLRVGGPNAGHTVYERPQPFVFHHLPSGARSSPSAKLILGPGSVITLATLLREIGECAVPVGRLFIDPQAMLIEEGDRKFEGKTLAKSIGSTAMGVGSATARKILRGAMKPRPRLARDSKELKPYIRETIAVLESAFWKGERILLEGTQGTGLSLHHGFYPHVTSRDTTVSGCLAEAGIAPSRVRRTVMVCRSYPIRVESPPKHSSGPMEGELTWDEIAARSRIPVEELKSTEKTSTTHRKRRVAEFDWTLLRKAASLNGPTDIALSFADYLAIENRAARRFDQLTENTIRFIQEIERVGGAPVSLIATRFHFRSIIDRRLW